MTPAWADWLNRMAHQNKVAFGRETHDCCRRRAQNRRNNTNQEKRPRSVHASGLCLSVWELHAPFPLSSCLELILASGKKKFFLFFAPPSAYFFSSSGSRVERASRSAGLHRRSSGRASRPALSSRRGRSLSPSLLSSRRRVAAHHVRGLFLTHGRAPSCSDWASRRAGAAFPHRKPACRAP